jgi:hypothetical protein
VNLCTYYCAFFLAGERLVQQNNQPTFFSPRAGVTKVIVNQSVDRIELQKVAEMYIWLLSILSIANFYCNENVLKLRKLLWSLLLT